MERELQLNRVPRHWTINAVLLNQASSYIELYTSCHWIGLHFIGSFVILSDYITSLDRTSFYWIVHHFIGSYISCNWIGLQVIGSETSFDRARGFLKKFVSQGASLDTYPQIWRLTCRVNNEQHKNNLQQSTKNGTS